MADLNPQQPPKKRRRRWPLILGAIVVLLVLLVALLPTFVSWGLGHGMIRNAINNQINGQADFTSIRASWFGRQAMSGLRIVDAKGAEAANVDVTVDAGLWQLVTQQPGPLEITLAGKATGEVREDGTISFADLAKPAPASPTPAPPSPQGPFRFPDLPSLTLNLAGLDVQLSNRATKQTLVLDDLKGAVAYLDPLQPITVDLRSNTITDGAPGTLTIKGHVQQLFAPDRTLSLRGAEANLDVHMQSAAAGRGIPVPAQLPMIDAAAFVRDVKLTFASDDLAARAVVTLDATGAVEGHTESKVNGQMAFTNILTSQGKFSPRAATANITLQASSIPFVTADLRGVAQNLKATIVSNDLTRTTVIGIDGNAQLEGHAATTLAASLSVEELFNADGTLQLAIEKITGTIQAATLPTAIVQPVLAATPIIAERDLGPVADVNASFSPGTSREVSVAITGPRMRVELQGVIDPSNFSLVGRHLLLQAPQAHPALVKGYTGLQFSQPTDVVIRLTSFNFPPSDKQTGRFPLAQVALMGTIVAAREPVPLILGAQPAATNETPASGEAPSSSPVQLMTQNVSLQVETPVGGLGQHLDVKGSIRVDGGSVSLQHRITNLFDSSGMMAVMQALPIGRLDVVNMPAETLVKFAPTQQELIAQTIGQSIGATITTSLAENASDLVARVQANAQAFNLDVSAVRKPQSLLVSSGRMNLQLTPALITFFQREAAAPIALRDAAQATIEFKPFELPATGPFAYALPSQPLSGTFSAPRLVLANVPSLTQPIGINELRADVTFAQKEKLEIGATGQAALSIEDAAAAPLAQLNYQMTTALASGSAAPPTIKGEIRAANLNVFALERLLGRTPGELAQWTGDQGNITLHIDGTTEAFNAATQIAMADFAGEFTATKDPAYLAVKGQTSKWTLRRGVLESRLNPKPAEGAPAQASSSSPPMRVLDDVPLTLNIRDLKLPSAMLAKEPFDPATAAVNIVINAGKMRFHSPATASGDVEATLTDLDVVVTSANMATGLNVTMRSAASAIVTPPAPSAPAAAPPAGTISRPAGGTPPPAAAQTVPGSLEVNGVIANLVNDQSIFAPEAAALRLNANIKDMPTALVDALSNLQGLLVAAVGPVMSATVQANNFSTNAGNLQAKINTTNGFIETTLFADKGVMRVGVPRPLHGELTVTPPLRERLLARVNPFLADIRTTEQPIRFSIAPVVLRLDDPRRLNADIEVTIGKVTFESGSRLMTIFRFAGQADRAQTVPGEVEPIIAKIRSGLMTYDKFAVHIDKFRLQFSGQINLVNETVNMRTEVPLEALTHSFQELEPYAKDIIVPLVYRGKLGEATMAIDPEFSIAEQAAKAGFKGALDQILKNRGNSSAQDLLNNIFGPKKPQQ